MWITRLIVLYEISDPWFPHSQRDYYLMWRVEFLLLFEYMCAKLYLPVFFGLAPILYIFLNTVQWFCLHNLHIVLLILSFTINHSFIIHYGVSCFASATENIVHTSVSTPVQTPKTPKNRSPMPEDRIVQEIIEPARAGLQHNHPTSPYGKTSFILLFILLCFSVVSFFFFFSFGVLF